MASVKYSSEIVTRLRSRIEQAIDAQGDKSRQRERAWQQFTTSPTGTEAEGRSQVQSSDVNSMITAACAQMVISFASDTVVSFAANNAQDESQAKAESRAVNKVLIEDNGGFRRILDGIQNALMYRTGYLKCWWHIDKLTTTMTFEDIDPDELAVLVESEQGIERRLISYDQDKRKARVEVTQSTNRLMIEAIANGRFFVDPDHEDQKLDGCRLCGEVHYMTRDELSRMGVPWAIVKQLPAVVQGDGAEQQTQRKGLQGTVEPIVMQSEICRVYEVYARLTFDEDDDRTYLYKCWLPERSLRGDEQWLLDPEPVSRAPYAAGSAFPIANRHDGEALSEKLYQVQAGKTELWRQWIDNVQNCSFGRYGVVVGQADMADVTTPKAGGVVRLKSPSALIPIPVLDVGMSIKAALSEFDKARSERGGASLDMIGAEMQIASDSAHGTERVYAAKELMVSFMARNLAESMVREVFLLAHAELRDGDGGPINVKIAEQWGEQDPKTWQPRTHCNVNVAPSFGERMLQANTLMGGLQFYSQAMQGGLEGELVTKAGLYKMATDWLRLNLVPDPESYFIDPASEQAAQAAQQKQQGAQQQMLQQTEMQKAILAIPEQIKAQASQAKNDQDTAFKYFQAVLESMIKVNETETGGVIDVIAARTQAKAVENANAGRSVATGGGANGKRSGGDGNGAGKS